MLVSGSVVRAFVGLCYLLILCVSSVLTYLFYSEPVLFAFVLTAVGLLVLSYPMLCLVSVTRCYDLEIRGCFRFEWIQISSPIDVEVQEKPFKLDTAFVHAYI